MHRHVSWPVPEAASPAQRAHPPSPQLRTPRGVSLYPVVRTIRSLTITAPTLRRTHVERVDARCAIRIKYVSHDGLVMGRPPSGSGSAAQASQVPLRSSALLSSDS